jgi:hypothetical protein
MRGVVVNLLDEHGNVVATDVTDSHGRYDFTRLAAGRYTVEVARSNFNPGGALAGMAASPRDRGHDDRRDSDADPVTLRSTPIVLSAGEKDSSVDFGFREQPKPSEDCKDDRHDKHGSRWPKEWADDCVVGPKNGHRGHDGGDRKGQIDWWGKYPRRGC